MSKRKKNKYFTPAKPNKIVVRVAPPIKPNKLEVVEPDDSKVAKSENSKVVESVDSKIIAEHADSEIANASDSRTADSDTVAPVNSEKNVPLDSEEDISDDSEEIAEPVEFVKVKDPFGCPDISVVIPMYNAENYIGECLESILAQTFKNFEVIVVDDCSEDNSPAIVDSFISKFDGRLTHFRLKKNTGGAGIPRNTGITLARGEYIYFMDSDDRVVPNALEDDFHIAKQYDADTVYHTLFYNLSADGTESQLARVPKYKQGDEVVLDDDLLTRVKELAQNKYYFAPWRSFNRRTFLIENELYFPNIRPYEDIVWSCALLIYAKRLVRVPTATYFYRDNENSMLRTEKSASQNAKFYLNPIILGLKSLDTFLSRHPFFENKPQLYYATLENYFNGRFTSLFKDSSELQPYMLYETLKEEFGKSLGEYDVLIPALCTALAQQQKVTASKLKKFKEYVVQSEAKIAWLENEIQRRKIKE